MSAANTSWTEQEDQDALAYDYEDFATLHPTRTWNAYRFRKSRIQRKHRVMDTASISAKPEPSDDELEELFTSLERAEAARAGLSPTEDTITVNAPDDLPCGIAFMSDIHAGASGVDYARFRHDLEVIRDTDGLYTIVNGDLLENAKVMSKAGNALYHAAFANPREQITYVRKRLSIARGKILAILSGNHDSRDGMYAGIDRLPQLCRDLDVPYGTEAGMTVNFVVGGHQYVVVAKHDYTGKSNITKSNSARRMWTEWPHSWDSADVIALAHLHEANLSVQYQRGQEVVWLRSGAFKIHDEYALSKGYKSTYGVPIVVFFPGTRKMIAFLDFDEGVRYLNAVRSEWNALAA